MRRPGLMLGAAFSVAAAGLLAAPFAQRVLRSWTTRVTVSGHSMEPTLLDGDWLLVDPVAFATSAPRPGDLVVARDPRDSARTIVKRVAYVDADGQLRLSGDHPAHADDIGRIGAVRPSQVIGKPWLRYWPPRRVAFAR